MKVTENVQSTVKPKEVEFDKNHVYVNSNVHEVPEEDRLAEKEQLEDGQTLVPMYSYKVTEYEKDEFLLALSTGQVTLNDRATAIEDMILEMSEVVYA